MLKKVAVDYIELVINLVGTGITYFGRDAFAKVMLNRHDSETISSREETAARLGLS